MPNAPIPPNAESQVYTVAVALEGKFKSFYAGKEVPSVPGPVDTEGTEGSETPAFRRKNAEARVTKIESEQTQIVVDRYSTVSHAAAS